MPSTMTNMYYTITSTANIHIPTKMFLAFGENVANSPNGNFFRFSSTVWGMFGLFVFLWMGGGTLILSNAQPQRIQMASQKSPSICKSLVFGKQFQSLRYHNIMMHMADSFKKNLECRVSFLTNFL